MCTVLLPPGVNLIAVNKYININQFQCCWCKTKILLRHAGKMSTKERKRHSSRTFLHNPLGKLNLLKGSVTCEHNTRRGKQFEIFRVMSVLNVLLWLDIVKSCRWIHTHWRNMFPPPSWQGLKLEAASHYNIK
jgi:hypothetical protein